MRNWLLAGLIIVFCSIFQAALLLADLISNSLCTPALIALIFTLVFILSILALSILNLALEISNPAVNYAQQLQDWEAQGVLETEDFQTTRAFAVEASDDEGPHLFLELHDGAVLYLNGQYLYQYVYAEAVNEDEENEDEDEGYFLFPCTQFTIRRHRENVQVVEILCQGDPLEVETFPLTFWESDYWNTFSFRDGERITDRTYDQLKRAN